MSSEAQNPRKKTWADVYLELWDGTIAEGWFRWAEWLLVTAALYALGTAGHSHVVVFLAYFSALLTGFYAMRKLELASDALVPAVRTLPIWARVIAAGLFFIVFMSLAMALAAAITTALDVRAAAADGQ